MVSRTAPQLRLVAYERVSTARQGQSGLGLDAQRKTIDEFARSRGAKVLARFTEVESGRNPNRPELAKASHLARVTGATLVIAKLDPALAQSRLPDHAARQWRALPRLRHARGERSDRRCHGALVAQAEREAISLRTKEALAVARARGLNHIAALGEWRQLCSD